jgi:hypothetical protein
LQIFEAWQAIDLKTSRELWVGQSKICVSDKYKPVFSWMVGFGEGESS